MAETISMPKLGFDMAEGTLVRWVKQVGENINKGDVLAEIETDKATVEVESSASGVVLQLHRRPGDRGSRRRADCGRGRGGGKEWKLPKAEGGKQKAEAQKAEKAEGRRKKRRLKLSRLRLPFNRLPRPCRRVPLRHRPLAKKIARDNKWISRSVQGTGPGGRVVRKDVEAALAGGTAMQRLARQPAVPTIQPVAATAEDQTIQTTKLRQAIGRRLVESKQTIPHFYVTHEYKMDALMAMRKQVNEYLPDNEKLSVNDFILKAVALTLRQFPNLNATIKGDRGRPVRACQCWRGSHRPRRLDDRCRQRHRSKDLAPDLRRSQSHGSARPRRQGQAR